MIQNRDKMKIISKYKDFYDFNYRYGKPDESVVYERTCTTMHGELPKETMRQLTLLNFHVGFLPIGKNKYVEELYTIGIYPNLFRCPCIGEKDNDALTEISKLTPIDFLTVKDGKSLIDFMQRNVDAKIKWQHLFKSERSYLRHKVRWETYVKDAPDIFTALGTPVFIYGTFNTHLSEHQEFSVIGNEKPELIMDFALNSLSVNLLKYHTDFIKNFDVYSSIENFLFTIKQEPISEPDNKTKIINAGFDLKTSFRKM
jgi:hypothetical protein